MIDRNQIKQAYDTNFFTFICEGYTIYVHTPDNNPLFVMKPGINDIFSPSDLEHKYGKGKIIEDIARVLDDMLKHVGTPFHQEAQDCIDAITAWNLSDIHPGDYIEYLNKHELGKVKRIRDEKSVFAWFHTGDTAASIDKNLYRVILKTEDAKKMSRESLLAFLHDFGFENDYAVEEIVKRCKLKREYRSLQRKRGFKKTQI